MTTLRAWLVAAVMVGMRDFGRWRGWAFVAGALVLVGLTSALSKSLSATIAAGLVAVVGILAGVLSQRGTKALSDEADRIRESARDVFVDHRGRLPRVRHIEDLVAIGVHRALGIGAVPPFVRRDRSDDLEEALRSGGFVLVVGESTAGKTRAAFEAVRRCLPHHVFVCPAHRAAVRALPAVVRRRRRCVVWLDDLERYLGSDGLTAQLITTLLSGRDRHVVVVATIRAQERLRYSPRRQPGGDAGAAELARDGRQVLDAAVEIQLDRRWSRAELARAAEETDERISLALRHSDQFGLAEYLAAGPQLLSEWNDAWAPAAHPRGAALVAAAVDARRAGCHDPIQLDVLRELHGHYLEVRGGAALRPEPWDDALAWATAPLYATSSLILPSGEDRFLAFDYLPDAMDSVIMPAAIPEPTWAILIQRADLATACDIGWAAYDRACWDIAQLAFRQSFEAGHAVAAAGLAECLGLAHETTSAEQILHAAIATLEASDDEHVAPLDLLNLRDQLAWWTGLQGKVLEALKIARTTAAESTRILGMGHRTTLLHRLQLARWEGETGHTERALELAEDNVHACTQHLGVADSLTLSSRFELGVWAGRSGDAARAVELFQALAVDKARVFGSKDWRTLDTRGNLALWTLEQGDTTAGLGLLQAVIEDETDAFGPTHPRTLRARLMSTHWVSRTGDPERARRLAQAIVADAITHLGQDHEITLEGRLELATHTAASARLNEAITELDQLIRDARRCLGPDHEITLNTRSEYARLLGESGAVEQASALCESVVKDRRAIQGTAHPYTQRDQEELEHWQQLANGAN